MALLNDNFVLNDRGSLSFFLQCFSVYYIDFGLYHNLFRSDKLFRIDKLLS